MIFESILRYHTAAVPRMRSKVEVVCTSKSCFGKQEERTPSFEHEPCKPGAVKKNGILSCPALCRDGVHAQAIRSPATPEDVVRETWHLLFA